jgi:hypothetical protein
MMKADDSTQEAAKRDIDTAWIRERELNQSSSRYFSPNRGTCPHTVLAGDIGPFAVTGLAKKGANARWTN